MVRTSWSRMSFRFWWYNCWLGAACRNAENIWAAVAVVPSPAGRFLEKSRETKSARSDDSSNSAL